MFSKRKKIKISEQKEKIKYRNIDIEKAYALYSINDRNITKVNEITQIPIITLRKWKIKYKWDLRLKKDLISIRKDIKDLIPSSVKEESDRLNNIQKTTVQELSSLLTKSHLASEMDMIKHLEIICSRAIEEYNLHPKSWKEIMATQDFISKRKDKIREILKIESQIEENTLEQESSDEENLFFNGDINYEEKENDMNYEE